jgi:agmatinase
MTQQSAFEYLRHGQSPCFRLPEIDAASPARYAGLDVVLLGVPHDGGTTYQPGARFAPYHVRRVSALVQAYHPVHKLDVFRTLRARDGGNVVFPPFDRAAMREAVAAEVAAIAAAGARPFAIGGDHSITLPVLRALAAAHGPLAVVHLDAHLDTSGPEVWGEAHHHGTPIRHAIAEGLIERGQLHQIGLRATWGGPEEGAMAADHGGTRATADEVGRHGAAEIAGAVLARVGGRPCYLTVDVDALDPAFAPGTGTPVPGGMTSREVLGFVRGLLGARVVGMDVVEVAPVLDHADVTCHLAAALLYEGLALVAHEKR